MYGASILHYTSDDFKYYLDKNQIRQIKTALSDYLLKQCGNYNENEYKEVVIKEVELVKRIISKIQTRINKETITKDIIETL